MLTKTYPHTHTLLKLRIRKLRLGFTAKLHIFTLVFRRTANTNTNPCISHAPRESEREKGKGEINILLAKAPLNRWIYLPGSKIRSHVEPQL